MQYTKVEVRKLAHQSFQRVTFYVTKAGIQTMYKPGSQIGFGMTHKRTIF